MADPIPFLIGLCLVALLLALFVSNASYDVFGSLLWYQSPSIWVVISAVTFSLYLLYMSMKFIFKSS